jgi:hypothetical protein
MLQTPIKCIFQTLPQENSVFTRFGAQSENCVLQLGTFDGPERHTFALDTNYFIDIQW